jgi:hypothetical protein
MNTVAFEMTYQEFDTLTFALSERARICKENALESFSLLQKHPDRPDFSKNGSYWADNLAKSSQLRQKLIKQWYGV